MNNLDDMFDEKKMKKSIRKARFILIFKIVVIVLIVFIIASICNRTLCTKFSMESYEANRAYVELTVPNGFILKSNDIFGFLGGNGTYTISKQIEEKAVVLENRISFFGLFPPKNFFTARGVGGHTVGEWPVNIWDESGYRKITFFNPNFSYYEYMNDLERINEIPEDKIIEMGISFDKPYDITECQDIIYSLHSCKATWVWLDEFTEESLKQQKEEAKINEPKVSGIRQADIIGFNLYPDGRISYDEEYDKILENLKKSNYTEFDKLYNEIMQRGKKGFNDARILGIVVQGTKEELQELKDKPYVKASSLGVVTDKLY